MGQSGGGGDFKYDIFGTVLRTSANVNATMYPQPTTAIKSKQNKQTKIRKEKEIRDESQLYTGNSNVS
jgi:hypothetical protein